MAAVADKCPICNGNGFSIPPFRCAACLGTGKRKEG